MQDIVNINSSRAVQTSFNTLFNIENITNFYVIGSSFFLIYYFFNKYKNSNIKDKTS